MQYFLVSVGSFHPVYSPSSVIEIAVAMNAIISKIARRSTGMSIMFSTTVNVSTYITSNLQN